MLFWIFRLDWHGLVESSVRIWVTVGQQKRATIYKLTRRVVQNIFAWSETCFGVTIVSKATFGWWWMAWLLAEIQFWSEFGWSKPHFHDHLWPFIGGLLPRGQWAASAWQNVPQNDWGLRAAYDSLWNLQFENGSYRIIVKHILVLHAKLVRNYN